MLRFVVTLLLAVILISLLRSVIGIVAKFASGLFAPPTPSGPARSATNFPAGGELKRDPVCGTFVPVATSVKKIVNGETLHFCSEACRDKLEKKGSA